MYKEIKALHNALESENIDHVCEEKSCENTHLKYMVITFQEEIELFNGHTLKHNLPVWFMQIENGKLYLHNNNGNLEMEITPTQGLALVNLFKESGVI